MTVVTASCWRDLAALVFPWRDDARMESAPAHARRWRWHVMIWTSLIAVLWCVNRVAGLERVMHSPWPTLHHLWLPLVGMMLYALCWLGQGLWQSLRRAAITEVDSAGSAWREACGNLEAAGIHQADLPLFLVLGTLTPEVQGWLDSSGAQAVDGQSAAPIQVFLHPEAIVIACGGSSKRGAPATSPGRRGSAALADAGLEQLGRLLLHDRSPRPPIQGIVISIPFSGLQSTPDLETLLEACREDLEALRQATGLETPIYLAVSGLDGGPAEADSVAGMTQGWVQRFPPLADLDPAQSLAMYQDGVDSLCLEQIPRELRSVSRLKPMPLDFTENARLQRWQSAVTNLRGPLQRLILEGTRSQFSEPGMVAGCYLLTMACADDGSTHPLWSDLFQHQGYAISAT